MGSRLFRIVLVLLFSTFAAWASVTSWAADLLVRDKVAAAAMIVPFHPRTKLALATTEVIRSQRVLSETRRAEIRNQLRRVPLSSDPLTLEAIHELADGNDSKAEILLREARARNPRSRLVRTLMFDRHLRSGRTAEAIGEIATLMELVPQSSKVLVPELAKIARDRRTRRLLFEPLRRKPIQTQWLLERLSNEGAEPEIVIEIWKAAGQQLTLRENRGWQEALVQSLVDKGDVRKAHVTWNNFSGSTSESDNKIFDPTFSKLTAPPPFGWKLTASGAGVAEPAASGALQVEYFGRAPVTLASQLLVLTPSHYRFSFRVEGASSQDGSNLSWALHCKPAGREIVRRPIPAVLSAQTVQIDFTVPDGSCAGQTLSIEGVASEFPKPRRVLLRHLAITKL